MTICGADCGDGAVGVRGDVGDEQHPVVGDGQSRAPVDEQGTGQTAVELVGDGAVVVRVVPVRADRVVGGIR